MKKLFIFWILVIGVALVLFFNGYGFNRRFSLNYLPQRVEALTYLVKHFFIHQNEGSIEHIIKIVSKKQGISEDLIYSIIEVESSFRRFAISPRGAMGYMQLMPATVKHLGIKDPFSAKENIEGGIYYLKRLLVRYGDIDKALAAYNAGPTKVDRFGAVPPYKETRSYIKKVKQNMKLRSKNRI